MRLFLFIGVPFVLLLSVLLLFDTDGSTPTAQAQAVDGASARQLFLPYIATGDAPIKSKSGIHLGNRGSSDWRAELFTLITGTVTGTWPAAVVVRSDQIFTLQRETTGLCRITAAILKLTGEGEPYNAFKYLDAAIAAGTKVIIRIAPSPGNFVDYEAPGDNHHLHADETPAGGNYCDETATGGRSQQAKLDAFRDIRDLAEEMSEIYILTVGIHEWPAERLYFEPANEPNYEWYQGLLDEGKATELDPFVNHKQAWIEMDNYFAALYGKTKALPPSLQILTPPLSQDLYGHHFTLGTCEAITVGEGGQHSGLDFMKQTYGYDYAVIKQAPAKADGFSLHNYWQVGQESWDTNGPISFEYYCDYLNGGNKDLKPISDHIAQYLPDGMAVEMRASGKLTFITEADLLAPCQSHRSNLVRKDNIPSDMTDYTGITQQSLLNFVAEEALSRYVIIWLLTNQYEGDNNCDNSNTEINWHEAYRETGGAREWFQRWWGHAQ